jgi:hypothetical protein
VLWKPERSETVLSDEEEGEAEGAAASAAAEEVAAKASSIAERIMDGLPAMVDRPMPVPASDALEIIVCFAARDSE